MTERKSPEFPKQTSLGSPPKSVDGEDLTQTRYGDPHAPMPRAGLSKTLVGMPADFRNRHEPARPQPSATRSLTAQPVRAIGTPEPDDGATRRARGPAQPPARPPALPVRVSAPIRVGSAQRATSLAPDVNVAAARSSAAQRRAAEPPALPARRQPSAAAPAGPNAHDSTQASPVPAGVVADAAAQRARGYASAEQQADVVSDRVRPPLASAPSDAASAISLPPPAAAAKAIDLHATRIDSFEPGPLTTGQSDGLPAPRARLSLDISRSEHPVGAEVRRWPALSLIGLAIVAFGAVIVLRAPQLLPQPMAAAMRRSPDRDAPLGVVRQSPGVAQSPAAAPGVVQASAAAPGVVQSPAAAPGVVQASAAAPGVVEATETARAASRDRVLPPASGEQAELEKQALDRLVVNDTPGAKRAYERLRAADPIRPEYGVMLELLTASAPTCGQPGQDACPAP